MKQTLLVGSWGLFLCIVLSAPAGVSPRIITEPNSYYFTSGTYYAESGATNVSISVAIMPGDPSWTGSVGFATKDGTAIEGRDYTAVSGTLWFDGPAWRTFDVPLHPSAVQKELTVVLVKTESDSYLTSGSAQVIIPAAPPVLSIAQDDKKGFLLSWCCDYTNYVIESALPSEMVQGKWTRLTVTAGQSNGLFVAHITPGKPSKFFRLRQKP